MMKDNLVSLTVEIELQPDEKMTLPEQLANVVGPGRWLITVQPVAEARPTPVRLHQAFLASYAPDDEGLYDDYVPR
jgi:hypothetical protein